MQIQTTIVEKKTQPMNFKLPVRQRFFEYLQETTGMTIRTLAKRLGVSVRSVYNNLVNVDYIPNRYYFMLKDKLPIEAFVLALDRYLINEVESNKERESGSALDDAMREVLMQELREELQQRILKSKRSNVLKEELLFMLDEIARANGRR